MHIHSLKLENFMLHRKFYRVFHGKTVVGIIAEYKDNPERSNKGGKSQIPEAIRWILTGQSRAKKDVELISWGADKMMGTLVLDDDGKKITIRRGRDIKGHGILEVSGLEKKAEAQEEINQLIGMTPVELDLTCFFSQGDIHGFMNLGPADKKKHLMRWLKNDHWFKLERAALDDLGAKVKKIAVLKAKADALQSQVEDESTIKKELGTTIKELHQLQAEGDRLQKKLAALKGSKKNAATLRERLDGIESEMDDLASDVAGKERFMSALAEAEASLQKLKNSVKPVSVKKEKQLREKQATLSAKWEALGEQERAMAEDHTGICPILKTACSRIEPDADALEAVRQDRCNIALRMSKVAGKITRLDAHRKAADKARALQDRVADLRGKTAGLASLKASLKRLRGEKKGVLATLQEANPDNAVRIGRLEDDLAACQETITEMSESVGQLRQRLKASQGIHQRVSKIMAKVTKLEARVSALRYVAFMFGKNGIPSQEIENAFDEIEDEINFVLARLGTNLHVQFQADREVDQWEDACHVCGWVYPKGKRIRECGDCGEDRIKKRKDELQLRVVEDGEEGAFGMESGGGKALLSIATRIATTRLLQRQTGSNFNVLFLDEPDAAFDSPNKKAFVKLITSTLVNKFGFEQVFYITHDRDIQESVPSVLKVVRHGKQSKTVWI